MAIFKHIGKLPQLDQPKYLDPKVKEQRDLDAQQENYSKNVLADCDRVTRAASASISRAIKTNQ